MSKYIILLLLCFIFSDSTKDKFDWKTNLIPVIGQIKNKKYLKAGILAGSQLYATQKFIIHNDKNQIAKRNTYAWWIISLYFYGIIDAYVDYNFKNFPKQNEEEE